VNGLKISEENDLRDVTSIPCNTVLKTSSQVTEAKRHLKALDLFPHHDTIKSWDTYKMIDIIIKADRKSFILDVGCNDSPICPCLRDLASGIFMVVTWSYSLGTNATS
jgi:hypothetical protein